MEALESAMYTPNRKVYVAPVKGPSSSALAGPFVSQPRASSSAIISPDLAPSLRFRFLDFLSSFVSGVR